MKETFFVETEVFQGPLDLLLSLIEKRKLLINEISLSQITDDYLEFIDKFEDLSLKQNANFILIAATLVLIKSKTLLPTLELTQEEENSIEELETRLKIFNKIKENESWIFDNYNLKPGYLKQETKETEVVFAPAKNISVQSINYSIRNIIASLPKSEKIPKKTVRKIISLEESIVKLSNKIRQNINLSFKEFSNFDKEEKVNVVVNFLAMLELVKQGAINVSQSRSYDDIEIQTREFDTPNYS